MDRMVETSPGMAGGTPQVERWFTALSPGNSAEFAVYCFPYAGAGANSFRSWGPAFGSDVKLFGLQLPGRETRFTEPPEVEASSVATAIAAHADRPYVVYGHSFGARLAFEVIHLLWARGDRLPIHFFPAACRAPHLLPEPEHFGLSALPDDELTERLARGGGTPAAILAEPELMQLLLPVVRADFGWLDSYVYQPRPGLPVPMTAFCAERDDIAPPAQVAQWRQHTAMDFALHTLPGDHFFLHERGPAMARIIETSLKERQ
jgi:surfactin synthase thioesterase subunit